MSIPEIRKPIYDVIDLAQFDEEYAGQTMRVMVNPSRAFRLGFINAALNVAGQDFIEYVAAITGAGNDDEAAQAFDELPADAFQWLFCYTTIEHDGKPDLIRPHVLTTWDERIISRVKAHAAQPKASAQPSAESTAAN